MIFHDRKLVFIHIPKTGGTTLRRLLQTIPVPPPTEGLGVHFSITQAIERYPGYDVRGYTAIVAKRNPWDRLASVYVQRRRDFDLGLSSYAPTHDYVKYHETASVDEPLRKLSVDGAVFSKLHVLDFEHLERDIRLLFESRFDVELGEIPHLHGKEDSYHKLQRTIIRDPAYRALIAERCREEIRIFNYKA